MIHQYSGGTARSYPHLKDPETGHVLYVEPGDPFDFGTDSPPGDGLWYAVPSSPDQASTGAQETEE